MNKRIKKKQLTRLFHKVLNHALADLDNKEFDVITDNDTGEVYIVQIHKVPKTSCIYMPGIGPYIHNTYLYSIYSAPFISYSRLHKRQKHLPSRNRETLATPNLIGYKGDLGQRIINECSHKYTYKQAYNKAFTKTGNIKHLLKDEFVTKKPSIDAMNKAYAEIHKIDMVKRLMAEASNQLEYKPKISCNYIC